MFNCLCINDLFALQRYKNFWTFLLFPLCFKALSTIYLQVGNFSTIVYTATVELTDNLNTTYKKKIPFIQQMTDQANIITEEMTLLDQIIRPIHSLFKN